MVEIRSPPTRLAVATGRAVRHVLGASAVGAPMHRTAEGNRLGALRVWWGSLPHGTSPLLVEVVSVVVVAVAQRCAVERPPERYETSHDPSSRCIDSSSRSSRSMVCVTVRCWRRSGPSWLRMSRLLASTASGLITPPSC